MASEVPRCYPITRRNSTVLGYDARCKDFDRWWPEAVWDSALPSNDGVSPLAFLTVPHGPHNGWSCHPIDDRPWYRVRPKRDGPRRAVKVDGVWHWEYHPRLAPEGRRGW